MCECVCACVRVCVCARVWVCVCVCVCVCARVTYTLRTRTITPAFCTSPATTASSSTSTTCYRVLSSVKGCKGSRCNLHKNACPTEAQAAQRMEAGQHISAQLHVLALEEIQRTGSADHPPRACHILRGTLQMFKKRLKLIEEAATFKPG